MEQQARGGEGEAVGLVDGQQVQVYRPSQLPHSMLFLQDELPSESLALVDPREPEIGGGVFGHKSDQLLCRNLLETSEDQE